MKLVGHFWDEVVRRVGRNFCAPPLQAHKNAHSFPCFSELGIADQISAHFAELHYAVEDKISTAEARMEARLKVLYSKMGRAQNEQVAALGVVRDGLRRRIAQTAEQLRADSAIEHSVLEQRLEDEWRIVRGHAHGLNIRRQVGVPSPSLPTMLPTFPHSDGRDFAREGRAGWLAR